MAGSDISGAQKASGSYADTAAKLERQRQQNIKLGTDQINQAYSGFNPEFYQQRIHDYTSYAMPQLAQQYRTNSADIGFGMANRGLLGSSIAQQKGSQLNRAQGQAQRGIVDAGIAQAQGLQNQVEGSRSNALSNLYASADPAGASRQAIAQSASFARPSMFQPLSDMFGSIAQSYYLANLLNRQQPSGAAPTSSSGGSGAYPEQPVTTSTTY